MMITPEIAQALKTHLFGDKQATVFTILDGASVPDLPWNLESFSPENVCLYRGSLEPDIAEVAPYLVVLKQDAPFTEWILTNGWGQHWGIFGIAAADLPTLRRHFRHFLMVNDESGKSLYFRYYDPRVLGRYLPTCTANELHDVFGPVHAFFIESAANCKWWRFTFSNEVLHQDWL